MKALVRMFVAIELASKCTPSIERLIYKFASSGADVKWVESGNFHLTLKFLGDVEQSDIPEVCRAFQKSVCNIEPFEIRVLGAGAFPSTDLPRTIWLGIDHGIEELTVLFNAIEKTAVELGFARENTVFRPHVTLGRIRKPTAALKDLSQKIAEAPRYDAGKTWVTHAVVYSSELTKRGPVYAHLATCPFAGVKVEDDE